MANWEPEQQFFDLSTPLPYREAGAVLNVSPLHVQTVVRGWTGHLGNAVVTALDEVMWDESANGPKPFPRTARLLTGIHGLQPPRPRTYTRFGNEFYEISDWAGGRVRSASCRGETSVPAVCRLRTLSALTSREASELRRRGDEIRADPAKDRRLKEREIEAVYGEIDALFRRALPGVAVLGTYPDLTDPTRGFDMDLRQRVVRDPPGRVNSLRGGPAVGEHASGDLRELSKPRGFWWLHTLSLSMSGRDQSQRHCDDRNPRSRKTPSDHSPRP